MSRRSSTVEDVARKKEETSHEQRRYPGTIHLARVADDRYRRRRRLLSESPALADPAFQHARLQPVDGRTDADWRPDGPAAGGCRHAAPLADLRGHPERRRLVFPGAGTRGQGAEGSL